MRMTDGEQKLVLQVTGRSAGETRGVPERSSRFQSFQLSFHLDASRSQSPEGNYIFIVRRVSNIFLKHRKVFVSLLVDEVTEYLSWTFMAQV